MEVEHSLAAVAKSWKPVQSDGSELRIRVPDDRDGVWTKGMYTEAIAALNKAKILSGGEPLAVAELGYTYAASGQRVQTQQMRHELQELATRGYVDPRLVAFIYIGLGEKDPAFSWLEKAYEDRSPGMIFLKVEPKFDSLRPDRRFADLMRRVGLQ